MRRRIAAAIVGVTAFVVLVLSIPLAVIVQRDALRTEVVRLQATVARALTEIEVPVTVAQLRAIEAEPDAPPPFGVYGVDGRLLHGVGPEVGDGVVERALAGSTESSTGGAIVVATAITDPTEHVVGVLRVTESYAGVNARARTAWLVIVVGDLLAVGAAWLLARRVSRRLAAPIVDLAHAARQVGLGAVDVAHEPTGIDEVDVLGAALADSSMRVTAALVREQRFSADVSHQLRTPLAALRLELERAGVLDAAVVGRALVDVDRLERTVEHLLLLARDEQPDDGACGLSDAVTDAVARWRPRLVGAGRGVSGACGEATVVGMSDVALAQVLDVLIDNASRHGQGAISIRGRRIAGGGAVDVADEGHLARGVTAAQLFERRAGVDNGIGLDLARAIAEADGARLVLTSRDPTTFSVFVLERS